MPLLLSLPYLLPLACGHASVQMMQIGFPAVDWIEESLAELWHDNMHPSNQYEKDACHGVLV